MHSFKHADWRKIPLSQRPGHKKFRDPFFKHPLFKKKALVRILDAVETFNHEPHTQYRPFNKDKVYFILSHVDHHELKYISAKSKSVEGRALLQVNQEILEIGQEKMEIIKKLFYFQ
jgi:hypothetical protein